MIKNFTADVAGTHFSFNVVNALRLEVFQVYADLDGKEIRFHMQDRVGGKFEITDKHRCPEQFIALEQSLSDVILNSQPAL